jgi:hypothetical protein
MNQSVIDAIRRGDLWNPSLGAGQATAVLMVSAVLGGLQLAVVAAGAAVTAVLVAAALSRHGLKPRVVGTPEQAFAAPLIRQRDALLRRCAGGSLVVATTAAYGTIVHPGSALYIGPAAIVVYDLVAALVYHRRHLAADAAHRA